MLSEEHEQDIHRLLNSSPSVLIIISEEESSDSLQEGPGKNEPGQLGKQDRTYSLLDGSWNGV